MYACATVAAVAVDTFVVVDTLVITDAIVHKSTNCTIKLEKNGKKIIFSREFYRIIVYSRIKT